MKTIRPIYRMALAVLCTLVLLTQNGQSSDGYFVRVEGIGFTMTKFHEISKSSRDGINLVIGGRQSDQKIVTLSIGVKANCDSSYVIPKQMQLMDADGREYTLVKARFSRFGSTKTIEIDPEKKVELSRDSLVFIWPSWAPSDSLASSIVDKAHVDSLTLDLGQIHCLQDSTAVPLGLVRLFRGAKFKL